MINLLKEITRKENWYQRNKERLKKERDAKIKADPEAAYLRNKAIYEKDNKAHKERSRKWKEAHPDKVEAERLAYKESGKKATVDRRYYLKRKKELVK